MLINILSHLCVWPFRREALQVHVGRLYVEVRPLWWADPSLSETHGSKAVPVPRLRSHLLSLRSPRPAQEAPPAGVSSIPQYVNRAEIAPSIKPLLNRSFIFSDVKGRFVYPVPFLSRIRCVWAERVELTDYTMASSYFMKRIVVQVDFVTVTMDLDKFW